MIDGIHDGQQRDVRSKSRIMEENLMVSIGKREIPVRIDSIVYVESRNRKVAVHTTEEEIEYYDKIEDLEHLLGKDFFRTHRGFLVNLKCVESYDRTGACMTGGDVALISKYKFHAFDEIYRKYRDAHDE